jgi:hypothetical protein
MCLEVTIILYFENWPTNFYDLYLALVFVLADCSTARPIVHHPRGLTKDCLLLTLIRMAIKKCLAVQLRVMYDYQATKRKQGEPPPHSFGGFFLLKYRLKQPLLRKKTFNKI